MCSRTVTLRPAPCLVLAAAALLLGASPATAASCGDYVHVRTPGRQAAPDPPTPADSPCAHGRCERAPLAPPAPEPPAPTGGGGHDAVLVAVVTAASPAAFGFANGPAGASTHVPSVPFHPPRA